ncbi:MAG TPA: ABC transporter substrate-binding protein [Alphaproteobacteria bacterium]|nr:ABC transporter substrate-binding protein [Alphaproteobacteria bacterium]
MDTIRIIQRFHSLFYTPQFVTLHLGVLEQEGLRAEVSTAASGAELSAKLLSGEADLGLSGSIRTLELAEKGGRDRLISILEVNSRDGFFLLGRGPQPRFQWADLVGSRLILFSEAPTPWLCLQQVLRNYGVDVGRIELIADLPTAQAVEAFLRGEADYLEQGQPAAERLVHTGRASVVASEGEAVGPVPFSAYLTIPKFAAERTEILRRFARAFYRAQQWMAQHSAEDISQLIAPSFPDIEPDIRRRVVARYLRQDTWAKDPLLHQEGFDYLQDILIGGGFISKRYPYAEHVNVEFAQAAMQGTG